MENDFFNDDIDVNVEFDSDQDLSEKGYGGRGTPMPGSPLPSDVQEEYLTEEVFIDEEIEEFSNEYTEEQEDLLSQADNRLEKANLYRMLLNHNLFGDVDCSPAIVTEVQEELKKIILDKLEVLLGIKAEQQNEETQFSVALPFNDLQIEALTLWADKLTKGKSKIAPPALAVVSKETKIKPMGGVKPKPTIQKLSKATPLLKKRELTKQVVPEPEQINRKARPQKEVKAEEHREEWVDPRKMSEDERLKHNIKNQDKYKQTSSKGKGVPMPDYQQQKMHYQTEMMTRSSNPSPLLQNLQAAITATQKEEMMNKMSGG